MKNKWRKYEYLDFFFQKIPTLISTIFFQSGNSNENQLREKKLHKKEQLAHRLSSSSEEIVEASIHEDEPIVMAQIPEEKPKPKAIPAFDNAYDADFDNSPPLHHYSAVHLETGLSPLEEAQRALRANRARHKPSNVSLAEEAKLAARQRYSNASDIRREEEEEVVEEDPAVVVPVLRKDLEVEEAPKSVRPPRYRKSREIEEPVVVDRFVEEEVDEKEDIDAIFEKYRKVRKDIFEKNGVENLKNLNFFRVKKFKHIEKI